MSLKFYPFVFNSVRSVFLCSIALASLILSFALPVAHANPSNSNYNYRVNTCWLSCLFSDQTS